MQYSPIKNGKHKERHSDEKSQRIYKVAGSDSKREKHKDKEKEPQPKIIQSNTLNSNHDNCEVMIKTLSKVDWDALKTEEAYVYFKDIEKAMKNIIMNDPKQALLVISDLSSLKVFMLKILAVLVESGIDFVDSKEIDKRIWLILKSQLEPPKSKGASLSPEDHSKIILTSIEFIQSFYQLISNHFPLNESPLRADSFERKIASNLISYYGELTYLRAKLCNMKKELHQSTIVSYFQAVSIYPFEGKYYMLLSTLSKSSEDLLGAIYWGIRAYGAYYPNLFKENLQKYLEEARTSFLKLKEKTEYSDIKECDYFKHFAISYLRLYNILFTKIGVDELYGVSSEMFDFLQKHMNYLRKEKEVNKPKEALLLTQIVVLTVFALQYCIEGYDPRVGSEKTKQKKTFMQIDQDVLARDTVKNTYGLIYHILDLVISDLSEAYLNMIVPVILYLSYNQNIADYMFKLYKQLKDKFVALHSEITKKEAKLLEDSKENDSEEITKLAADSYIMSDKTLLGFAPFVEYYETIKDKTMLNVPNEKVLLVRLRSTKIMLETLKCASTSNGASESDKDTKDIMGIVSLDGFPSLDSNLVSQMESFGPLSIESKEVKDKSMIILDGQNVAIRHGDTQFSAEGLQIALDYWIKRGHPVHAMLPDYCFNKEEVARRKVIAQSTGDSLKHVPNNVDLLLQLKAKGLASGIPNWNYDDSYIIEYAKNKGAYIVTNDRYNDHIEKYSKNDGNKKAKLKKWIRDNCISFTFIGKDFIPDPDFMNLHMK